VPYTVRNTFIDWAPTDDQDSAEGVFSTWHHPARQPCKEEGELEDGEIPDSSLDTIYSPSGGQAGLQEAPSSPPLLRNVPPERPGEQQQPEQQPSPCRQPSLPSSPPRLSADVLRPEGRPERKGPILEESGLCGNAGVEVRNTFIDWAPTDDQDSAEGVFSTWHHPARQPCIEEGDLEDGEIPDNSLNTNYSLLGGQAGLQDAPSSSPLPRSRPPERPDEQPEQPSRHRQPPPPSLPPPPRAASLHLAGQLERKRPPSEEGEMSANDGGLEDGELPDEGEDESLAEKDDSGTGLLEAPAASSATFVGARSLGSARHGGEGGCRPCAWMHKSAAGCRNGANCEYCHLCPPGEIKRRKQEKLQRRFAESKQMRELAASGWVRPGGSPTGAGGGGGGARGGGVCLQAMEPCYIEIPGVSNHRPIRASIGSIEHATGQCRPCAWVHKDASGCTNGASCTYCHLCPPGELKRRKREKWETQQRAVLEKQRQLVGAVVADAEQGARAPAGMCGLGGDSC